MKNIFWAVFLMVTKSIFAEQILPDDLFTLPVLIEIPLTDNIHSSFGTGIYLYESNKVFLVTAAHCLFDIHSADRTKLINSNCILSALVSRVKNGKNVISVDLKQLNAEGKIKRHPTHDVAVVFIASMTKPDTNGIVLDFFVPGVESHRLDLMFNTFSVKENCILFSNIPTGNETYILGYPRELINENLPQEVDFNTPLIRKGIVSQENQQTEKLIIDSGVYGGNSGGPIMIVQHPSFAVTSFQIGGLMTQFVPVETRMFPEGGVTNNVLVNSGYSVAEPIDYAVELMRQF